VSFVAARHISIRVHSDAIDVVMFVTRRDRREHALDAFVVTSSWRSRRLVHAVVTSSMRALPIGSVRTVRLDRREQVGRRPARATKASTRRRLREVTLAWAEAGPSCAAASDIDLQA